MDALDQIREFNRFYTGALGLLGRSYLNSGRSLAEVRVVHDLASAGKLTARQIARALAMDEAQLSRILSRLTAEGLVERRKDPSDQRQSFLTLTSSGMKLAASFAAASRSALADLVPTKPLQRALADHLAAARAVIAQDAEVTLRPARPGDAGWIISEHGRLYAEDEGYDQRFEGLVAGIIAQALERNDPQEHIIIAERDSLRLGTISCMRENDTTARLRLFLVLPEARGLGLGQKLHDACLNFARQSGYSKMVLWTHESHRSACALYAKNGWTLMRSVESQAFGQSVVDQDWHLTL